MFMNILLLVLCVSLSYCEESASERDRIPDVAKYPSMNTVVQYSGYLDGVSSNIRLHYWLVEAETTPEEKPLMVWLNGGPGCSSMYGLLTTNGPFMVVPGPDLTVNEYSWHKIANVLYLETPAGVGFSYARDNNITTDDDQMAKDTHRALKHFVTRFPKYENRDLYISGESYAGVYIPLLGLKVLNGTSTLRLKGLAIGNGYMNAILSDTAMFAFMHGHNLIDESKWATILSKCCKHGEVPPKCMLDIYNMGECGTLLHKTHAVLNNLLNRYNVYAPCLGGAKPSGPRTNCLDDKPIMSFLRDSVITKAIHVLGSITWEVCNIQLLNEDYKMIYDTMKNKIEDVLKRKVPVLLFAGDFDMVVAASGIDWFLDTLTSTPAKPYGPWLYTETDNTLQVGGFRKVVTVHGTNITYSTVRGAGHSTAADKPLAALHMIKEFFKHGTIP